MLLDLKTMTTAPKAVLFVCLGNICRSPSAQAIFSQNDTLGISFDSAATGSHTTGQHPDPRAIQIGKEQGYNELSNYQARQVSLDDFSKFDVIFAMDKQNLADLQSLQNKHHTIYPNEKTAHLLLLGDTKDQGAGTEIADPYYGDLDDFRAMFDELQALCQIWQQNWQNKTLII